MVILEQNDSLAKLCTTRWTVKANDFNKVINNFGPLFELWDICLDDKLGKETRSHILGYKSHKDLFRKYSETKNQMQCDVYWQLQKTSFLSEGYTDFLEQPSTIHFRSMSKIEALILPSLDKIEEAKGSSVQISKKFFCSFWWWTNNSLWMT